MLTYPTLTYVTGNQKKFDEAKAYFPEVERLQLDLPEIQSLDSYEIIEAKLAVATRIAPDSQHRALIVEDVSLTFDAMGGLPGPLIKFFVQEIGSKGLYHMAQSFNATRAHVTLTMGLALPEGKQEFFQSKISGTIVEPKGSTAFGFDPIFAPDGLDGKTFGELSTEQKNAISHRGLALKQMREYLQCHLGWKI